MDAVGADEDIAIMCTPIRTVIGVSVLENGNHKVLRRLWRPRDWAQQSSCCILGRKYLQVNGQRAFVIAINTFKLLRSVHTVWRHACQQLAKKGGTVYDGSEFAVIFEVLAYEADKAALPGALSHQRLDTFLRHSPSALKTLRCRVADQF